MNPQLKALLKQAQGLSPLEQPQKSEHLTQQVSIQSKIVRLPKRLKVCVRVV